MNLVLFLCLLGPVQCVALSLDVAERLVGRLVLDPHFPILVNEDLPEERLVAQPPVLVIAPAVDQRHVCQQRQTIVEILSCRRVLVVMRGQLPLDVIKPGFDASLLLFEQFQRGRRFASSRCKRTGDHAASNVSTCFTPPERPAATCSTTWIPSRAGVVVTS